MGTVRAQKRTHSAQQGSRGVRQDGEAEGAGGGERAELWEISMDASQGAARMTGPEAGRLIHEGSQQRCLP